MITSREDYHVASLPMEEIPIGDGDRKSTIASTHNYAKPSIAYCKDLGAQTYWEFFLRYKFAIFLGTLSIALFMIFIGSIICTAPNVATQPDGHVREDHVNTQVTSLEDLLENFEDINEKDLVPGQKANDIAGELAALYELMEASSEEEDGRPKRSVEMTPSGRSCRLKNNEHCKKIAERMKNLVHGVHSRVNELNKLMTQTGVAKDNEIGNFKITDIRDCFVCSKNFESDSITFFENSAPAESANIPGAPGGTGNPHAVENLKKVDSLLRKFSNQTVGNNSSIQETKSKDDFREDLKIIVDQVIPENIQTVLSTSPSTLRANERKVSVEPDTIGIGNSTESTTVTYTGSTTAAATSEFENILEIGTSRITPIASMPESTSTRYDDFETATMPGHLVETTRVIEGYTVSTSKANQVNRTQADFVVPSEDSSTVRDANIPESGQEKTSSQPEKSDSARVAASRITVSTSELSDPSERGPRIVTIAEQSKDNFEPTAMTIPTAETMKFNRQTQYTPPVSWMPYPVCFFGSQNALPYRHTAAGSIVIPASSVNYPPGPIGPVGPVGSIGPVGPVNSVRPSASSAQFTAGVPFLNIENQGVQYIPVQAPVQYAPTAMPNPGMFIPAHKVGPTGPGLQNFHLNTGNQPPTSSGTQPGYYYCTYVSNPTLQFPAVPNVSEYQRSSSSNMSNSKVDAQVSMSQDGPRYGHIYSDYDDNCPRGSRSCNDGSACILKSRWCDGNVDCADVSDETNCSCRDRVGKDRICDGYFDCPRGEDELGCFGCDKRSFSCDDWTRRSKSMCVPLTKRCDGNNDCPNGRDELDCNILSRTVNEDNMFMVGDTSGYLHRNWQGRWYLVCARVPAWTMSACLAEVGSQMRGNPMTSFNNYPGHLFMRQYLVETSSGEIGISGSCQNGALYVQCPAVPCGTRVLPHKEFYPTYNILEDPLLGTSHVPLSNATEEKNIETGNPQWNSTLQKIAKALTDNHTNIRNDSVVRSEGRIVGGRASQPRAWPFLVAIYTDGSFHCGGTILTEHWILTAAHCVERYRYRYYEIRAGVLRRLSFSPMAQTQRAVEVVLHPNYNRQSMKNDVALIRLKEPLHFNRWVRPICLPKSDTAGPNWRMGPEPASSCIVAGWGATIEHGLDPDHMREATVPILPFCKHPEDRNEAEICAGIPQGGVDACQGDSGGPLICLNPQSGTQWYVAGIVSHGDGCGRPEEPGAYTKVSHFVDWIDSVIMRTNPGLGDRPLQRCPGFTCHGEAGKCIPAVRRCDKRVDCLSVEDEVDCQTYNDFDLFRNLNTAAARSADADLSAPSAISPPDPPAADELPVNASVPENSSNFLNLTTSRPAVPAIGKTSLPTPINSHFVCTRMLQRLPNSKRCNKVIDCEDATDEENCTCRDYLRNLQPTAVCDAHVDCDDGSDEENCHPCDRNEFHCARSGKCIPLNGKCDRVADCHLGEDEQDCFSLSNGHSVTVDLEGRPQLNVQGIVSQYQNGQWRPFCLDTNGFASNDTERERSIGQYVCRYLGFEDQMNTTKTIVSDKTIDAIPSAGRGVVGHGYPDTEVAQSTDSTGDKTCVSLHVECNPTLNTSVSNHLVSIKDTENPSYLWPWHAAIFVDGRYHCSAVLLEHSWLLTSARCVQNIDLRSNYTAAMLGLSQSYLHVDGPHQQVLPVDQVKLIQDTDAVLLHLQDPVNATRHVQPIFLNKRMHPASDKYACVATGVDDNGRTRTIFLQADMTCSTCNRCYKRSHPKNCFNETSLPWSGTIVCQSSFGWYPAAIFHEENGYCGFQEKRPLTSIDFINARLAEAIDEKQNFAKELAKCDGFRCLLGQCVSWDRICDGVPDCRDGADEDADFCRRKKDRCRADPTDAIGCRCSKSELRCANGECVPKERFCDHKVDCADGSDEPANCTCAAYLELTSPERICDGTRNCFDKTDEDPETCYCKDSSFKCGKINGTELCVPQDFVCDGQQDCFTNNDETQCRKIKGSLRDPPGTGEVIRRFHGVWHTECFDLPVTSPTEVEELCKSLGYKTGRRLTERRSALEEYGEPRVVDLDNFYMLRVNENTWLTMRNDAPLARLASPREPCHRLLVSCV
ncbi:serine protease nudel [Cephus cinctus]|uniref:Serine protease nudel n=1 Tax=Cephus cinctus TaxID=211228 RepID=A0AAJ7FQQ7_CEPCN|nr:serine protease nudel [Cephus cinctus]